MEQAGPDTVLTAPPGTISAVLSTATLYHTGLFGTTPQYHALIADSPAWYTADAPAQYHTGIGA
eukprot:164816-Rhodomonas_salina.1